ncbi:MAG: DNA-processing protein DprA [Rickettsiaceae bacterium]|nr:DNA-processing protein DprA [Rickettsiaceae bacterium]
MMHKFLSNFFSRKEADIDSATIDTLRLIRSKNLGIKTFYNIINYFGSPTAAIENLPELLKKTNSNIKITSKDEAEREIETIHKVGASIISFLDPRFSFLLKQIKNCPPILTYKGDITLFKKTSVAIVGARNCSISAKNITQKFAKELSEAGIIITSGLARGVDTEAHQASKPKTIGVIAGGIDNIYPPENHRLFKDIAENGGLLLAELEVGNAPLARHFPQRNRIISGISSAVIIIEAGLNSGSLITANFAIEQNRELFACPGYPLDPRCKGTNKLIKEGANLIESSEEVLIFLNETSNRLKLKEQISMTPAESTNDRPSNNRHHRKLFTDEVLRVAVPNARTLTNSGLLENPRTDLTLNAKIQEEETLEVQNIIFELLSGHPVSIEDIAAKTNLPMKKIMTAVLELELAQKISSTDQGKYSKSF